MRSYIFTEQERTAINQFLEGAKIEYMYKIKYRVTHFKNLEKDVDLYLALKERLKQSSLTPESRS